MLFGAPRRAVIAAVPASRYHRHRDVADDRPAKRSSRRNNRELRIPVAGKRSREKKPPIEILIAPRIDRSNVRGSTPNDRGYRTAHERGIRIRWILAYRVRKCVSYRLSAQRNVRDDEQRGRRTRERPRVRENMKRSKNRDEKYREEPARSPVREIPS